MRKQYSKKFLLLALLAPAYGMFPKGNGSHSHSEPSKKGIYDDKPGWQGPGHEQYGHSHLGGTGPAKLPGGGLQGYTPSGNLFEQGSYPSSCGPSSQGPDCQQGYGHSPLATLAGAASYGPWAPPSWGPRRRLNGARESDLGAPECMLTQEAANAYLENLAPALTILAQVMFASAPNFAQLLVEFLEHTFLFESMGLLYLTGTINLLALLILAAVCWKSRPGGEHSFLPEGNFLLLIMLFYPPASIVLSLLCSYFCPVSYLWIAKIVTLAPLLLIELCRPTSQMYRDCDQTVATIDSRLSTISLLVGVASIAGMFLPVQLLTYLPYLSLVLYCISALAFIYGALYALDLQPTHWLRSRLGLYNKPIESGVSDWRGNSSYPAE